MDPWYCRTPRYASPMALLTLRDAELAYGFTPLLDRANLTLGGNERIGLIGRNGSGKSSLLRVIAGAQALDDGVIERSDGLSIVLVEQEPALPAASTLRESLSQRGQLAEVHDERERWRIEARLSEFLHRFGLDEAEAPERASGGERKRAALALALALAPDLLLLDEPTNHLDIDGIALAREAPARRAGGDLSSRTTARFSTASRRGSSSSIAGCCARIRADFAAYEARKDGRARSRGARRRASSTSSGAGGSVDPQGRRGAPHARRGSRARGSKRCAAERAQRRERAGNVKLSLRRRASAPASSSRSSRHVLEALRRRASWCATSLRDPARRPRRPDRPERRRASRRC